MIEKIETQYYAERNHLGRIFSEEPHEKLRIIVCHQELVVMLRNKRFVSFFA